jgi:thiol-disulfide isomerase/thioredoxin
MIETDLQPIMPAPDPSHRIWLFVALAFVAFWGAYLSFFGPRRRALLEGSGMSQPAAYEWSLLDLNDQPVSFARFKGKPVFLNVWATWCGPCVSEMPSIARLARDPRFKAKHIEFVCVSVDASARPVRRFLEGRDWTMTFLRSEKLPAVYETEGIPATFVIAPSGRIAAFEVGAADWDQPRVAEFLLKLQD